MAGDIDLRLFGSIHVDRPSKVERELDEMVEGADAIFIELPDEWPGWRTYASALLRAPAAVLGAVARDLTIGALFVLSALGRPSAETLAVERVSEAHDLPVYRVDDHPIEVLGRVGWQGVAANWLLVLALLAAFRDALPRTVGVLVAGFAVLAAVARLGVPAVRLAAVSVAGIGFTWVLWTGVASPLLAAVLFLAFVVTVAWTLDHRNRQMLDRVQRVAAAEGHDDACLVTGKAHLRGLVADADERAVAVGRVHASKLGRRSDASWHADEVDLADLPGVTRPGRSRLRRWLPLAHPDPDRGTERAALPGRAFAALVDLVGTVLSGAFLGLSVGLVTTVVDFGDVGVGASVVAGTLAGAALYTVMAEGAFGRTPGKALVGLVVVSTDGSPCSWRAAVIRNLLRPVDLLGGVLALAFTRRHRRIGDLAAGTVVCQAAGENG